ncbi:MetQ/NlpA family ABC transporter substrate-binding protein [Clostridium sp. AN503]|uniref:MetQ/NlpA family ABC transporter substrate-binding protein n=1 Tax=Clostridium sp. AN503 TaxID=3160598 RepID=UPI003457A85D
MKKSIIITAAVLAATLTACGGSKPAETTAAATEAATAKAGESAAETGETAAEAPAELKELLVGASPAPHAEILEAASKALEEKGYKLVIKEYTDYVQPNLALNSGDLDANYFQHLPYLEQFNEQNGTKLVSAGAIHYEPFGIYAGKTASLDALADGAKVAVPNDATNEARALLLLEAQGLIKLTEGVGLNATKTDVVENPKNLDILEIEAAQVPRSLQDVDIAVVNGNYAIEAGLKVSDALAVEASDSEAAVTYGNIVAVQEGKENDEAVKALVEALTSEDAKAFIESTYEGAVVPLF